MIAKHQFKKGYKILPIFEILNKECKVLFSGRSNLPETVTLFSSWYSFEIAHSLNKITPISALSYFLQGYFLNFSSIGKTNLQIQA